jgi:Ca2+-binding EF-hand superfamily protein
MKRLLATALVGTILIGLGGVPARAAGKAKVKGQKDPAATFRKRDKDGDGSLTRAEFEGKKGGEKAQARFQKLDKDKDGKVTLVEFTTRGKKKKNK